MGTLSKGSGENDIRKYFTAISELRKSGEEFPVSLEDVWPLGWTTKGNAVRDLMNSKTYVQDVDYKVFIKNDKNLLGGRSTNEYWLSIPCLEFFIARKKREVFEVYRQVFHKAMEQAELTAKEPEENPTELMQAIKAISNLRISDEAKEAYIRKIMDQDTPKAVPPARELPAPGGFLSATVLLKRHRVNLTASEMNETLEDLGLMERTVTRFRKLQNVLVGYGLNYGKNVQSRYYPDQTMPVYDPEKFDQLLDEILQIREIG